MVPKQLSQVSFHEIHNSIVSLPEEGGIKETRDAENNIIFIDYKLRNILPPQMKNMYSWNKVMCNY